jgi:heme/copper-type cytochrome/quinol oxidase subunit 4
MDDTSAYLRGLVARALPGLGLGGSLRDLSQVPPREMRVVFAFSFIWLGGRVVAIAMLALVQIPLLWKYFVHFATVAGRGRAGMTFEGVALLLSLALLVTGFSLWILEIRRKRRSV